MCFMFSYKLEINLNWNSEKLASTIIYFRIPRDQAEATNTCAGISEVKTTLSGLTSQSEEGAAVRAQEDSVKKLKDRHLKADDSETGKMKFAAEDIGAFPSNADSNENISASVQSLEVRQEIMVTASGETLEKSKTLLREQQESPAFGGRSCWQRCLRRSVRSRVKVS